MELRRNLICLSWAFKGSRIWNFENLLHAAGMLILFDAYLGICFWTSVFSSFILLHVFVHSFDTLKFRVSEKGDLALYTLFSLVVPVLHESENSINLPLTVFDRQLPGVAIEKLESQGNPLSSSSDYFPLCPNGCFHSPNFLFKSPPWFSVCVWRPRQTLRTVCFECSLCQPRGPSSKSPSCALPCQFYSPSSLAKLIWPRQLLQTVWFWMFAA